MIQWLVQLAIDEGGEVPNSLLGGERDGQHGGVREPLVSPIQGAGDPGLGSQQLPGCLFGGIL